MSSVNLATKLSPMATRTPSQLAKLCYIPRNNSRHAGQL